MSDQHTAEDTNQSSRNQFEDQDSWNSDEVVDQVQYEQDEISADDKLWSAIGYLLPIFAIIALFQEDKKERKFIHYHAVQAVVFGIILLLIILIVSVVTFLFGSLCAPLVWLITLWPSYDAYRGKYTDIPYVTGFIKNRGWV